MTSGAALPHTHHAIADVGRATERTAEMAGHLDALRAHLTHIVLRENGHPTPSSLQWAQESAAAVAAHAADVEQALSAALGHVRAEYAARMVGQPPTHNRWSRWCRRTVLRWALRWGPAGQA